MCVSEHASEADLSVTQTFLVCKNKNISLKGLTKVKIPLQERS